MFVPQLKLHLPAHLIEFIDLTRQMIINVGKFAFVGGYFCSSLECNEMK